MLLNSGERLGPYEVVSLIGTGGMGEVYLASDTRLGRQVAIKVSAREFTNRFDREARAISSLNHPHICTLHDVGPNYLVMEFVEGQTLAQLLARGPLPLETALRYAIQIADALAAAHAKGVIHRDLKPGNILVTKNGVKVLDFGLAKLTSERLQSDPSLSPTLASNAVTRAEPITVAGMIVGTLHYMSPEQVEAKETDPRSDIFSFGAIVYEMLAGRRAFDGDTPAAILATVLRDQPVPINQTQTVAPRPLERALRKCLEKHPDDRWQSARDLKAALELIDSESPARPTITTASRRAGPWRAIAAVSAAVALASVAWAFWPKPQPPARVTRFQFDLPEGPRNQFDGIRVSPDGTKLAFNTSGDNGGIWIHDLDSVANRLLAGTAGATGPMWSPDSRSLAFGLGNRLMRIDTAGGAPRVLCESATTVGSGVWTPGGDIVFGGRGAGPLQRVPAAGGVQTGDRSG